MDTDLEEIVESVRSKMSDRMRQSYQSLHSLAQSEKDTRYSITFKIQYKTEFGDSLYVVGSIEELGCWNTLKCGLKWTENHLWVSEPIQILSSSFFKYKYVIVNTNHQKTWEQGPNRIGDLNIKDDSCKSSEFK